jgi:hypothetical protein
MIHHLLRNDPMPGFPLCIDDCLVFGSKQPAIRKLVDARAERRKNKDWAGSDGLRDQLLVLGYVVIDMKGTQVVTVAKSCLKEKVAAEEDGREASSAAGEDEGDSAEDEGGSGEDEGDSREDEDDSGEDEDEFGEDRYD